MVASKKNARVLTGVVVSDAADKTVSVMVVRQYRHSLYKKIIKERKKYLAHDKNNEFKKGDLVRIQECAPVSKRKTWFVKEKIDTQRS
jgi:small subunit ribosomal protein S17